MFTTFFKFVSGISLFKSKILNFVVPNLLRFIKDSSYYVTIPICNQKTFITGEGLVEIGKNCQFGYRLGGFHRNGTIEFQARLKDAVIKIGSNVNTNNNIFICSAEYIEIGDDTLIGQNVTIMDFEAHSHDPKKRREIGEISRIIIGRNVWIGNNVMILKDSEIGDNTIVAAGSVVTGKFPSNIVIGGVPAKFIKTIDGKEN